ncbi:MAG: SRPBCC domain-containing protein [Alphaproteobacteria bacterium]|nr:SRPBCC domain-containing protein [Alphaproteobacteria bacterium]
MPAIRRQIMIAAPPREVWKALTTGDGLSQWLVDEARIDGRKGGRVVLISQDDDGEPVEERGIIHKWRPTSQLEITFDSVGKGQYKGTRLTFQVAVDGGETRVSLVHAGSIFDDAEENARVSKEWRQALSGLQSLLDAD